MKMMKRLPLLFACLLFVLPCSAQTWTHIQYCAARIVFGTVLTVSGQVYSINVDGGTNHCANVAAGHVLTIQIGDGIGDTKTITSVSGGCSGSWVIPAAMHASINAQAVINGAYCLNSAATSTSIGVTVTGTVDSSSASVDMHEWSWSGSSVAFDDAQSTTLTTSSTSEVCTALTIGGSSDVISQYVFASTGNASSVTAPFNTNLTSTGSDGNGLAFTSLSWVINSTAGSAPTWTWNASAQATCNAIAIKGVSTASSCSGSISLLGVGCR
jgi:hypothetical protein